MPLRFVGPQGLRWSGGPKHGGKEIFFNGTSAMFISCHLSDHARDIFGGAGTYVTEGTTPANSQWSRCPIPRNDMHQTGRGFAPPCMQFGMPAAMCQGMEDGQGGAEPTLEIVDRVLIPEGTPPGECECTMAAARGDLGFAHPPTVVRRCTWLALVRPCPHCLLRMLLALVLFSSASHCCETQKERFAGHQGLRGEQPDLAYAQELSFLARWGFAEILTEELCCLQKAAAT